MIKNSPNSVWIHGPWILGTLLGALGMPVMSMAAAQSMVALAGHVPPQVAGATLMARAAADEPVTLSLAVKLDQNLLDQTLEELYGRNASTSKHFLSSSEFAQKFGLADKRKWIKDFALANGLTVESGGGQAESMVVKVSGGTSLVEKAFRVQLNNYRAPDGRLFRANDTNPAIPATLEPHLGAVLGLSDIAGVAHPHVIRSQRPLDLKTLSPLASGAPPPPSAFTGSLGPFLLAPADIQAVYGLSQFGLNGSGQKISLFELDGFDPADIALYEAFFHLPNIPLTFISVDGTANLCDGAPCVHTVTPTNGVLEVALDIEMVAALAPSVSEIRLYTGPNSDQGILDAYDKIATENAAPVISTSWGLDEADSSVIPSFIPTESQIFQRLAVQGETLFAASGDCGAYDTRNFITGRCVLNRGFNVDDPASQQYVTGVGGTSLAGSVGSFTETTWNTLPGGGSSGGGVSAVSPIPSYQVGIAGTASQQFRNVPDVALNADPDNSGYFVVIAGNQFRAGGTSAAAPLWAALTVLINQQRAAVGKGQIGFINPLLYQLGTSTSSVDVYNDITLGNNVLFNAGKGYDNATGWGSFRGSGMIVAATAANALILGNLSNVFAYPNPWDTRKYTNRQIHFKNLPDGATVKIYTISGFWVKTVAASGGGAVWDLTNDAGDRAASGLYFYLASDGIHSVKGTIAIIK